MWPSAGQKRDYSHLWGATSQQQQPPQQPPPQPPQPQQVEAVEAEVEAMDAEAEAEAEAERVEHARQVAADAADAPHGAAPSDGVLSTPPHARRTPLGNPADGTAAVQPVAASANVPAGGPAGGKHASARPAVYPPPRVAPDEPSENSPPAAPSPPTAGVGSSQADPILL